MSNTRIPAALRTQVFARDKHRCLWCGKCSADGVELHVDHVVPEKFGGKTTIDNLGTLCKYCNLGKGADYYGHYLLSTMFQIPRFWDNIIERNLNTGLSPIDEKNYDGCWHELSVSFYYDAGGGYQIKCIKSYFLISEVFMIAKCPDSEIKIIEKRMQATDELKKKVKDFLIEKKGYLQEKKDYIVFCERK